MRGFARILEAIIASVVILTSLSFFFVQDVQQSGWGGTSLQITAQDALQSLYLNGTLDEVIKQNYRESLDVHLSAILPRNVDFSVRVKGIPDDTILVACADCSPGDVGELNLIFDPLIFEYKERRIEIRTEALDLSEPVKEGTDIMFFFNKNSIISNEALVKDFLSNDGSVVLLSDLLQEDVEGVVGSIFNLTWAGALRQNAVFDDVFDGRKTAHYAGRYYANITGTDLSGASAETFTVFNSNGVKSENDNRNIVMDGSVGTSRIAYSRAVEKTSGRTMWIADYSRGGYSNQNTEKIDALVKSSVMWASEEYSMDTTVKNPAPVHFRSSIIAYRHDTYIIELILWRAFF